MLVTLIADGIIGLLAVIISVWIALKVQQRQLLNIRSQQEAWERAQEGHQRIWEVRQEKHTNEIEKKFIAQVQDIRHEWRRWEAKDAQRVRAMEQRYDMATAKLSVEYELARLPHVEETPLPVSPNDFRQHVFDNWQPPRLYGADLSHRDLSYRYLGRADLREAQLAGTIFYMADLSGATLAGADLSGADLSGANLSGTDLRNATLTNANLLVADLHNAVLIGANLRGARNLEPQQVYSAIYDSTTQLDAEVDITMTGIPSVRRLPTSATSPVPATSAPIDITSSTQSTETSTSMGEQGESAEANHATFPAIAADVSTPPVEPGPVDSVEPALSDRTIPKRQSLKPPVLLPLPPDDSQPDLMSTNSLINGQHHGHADPDHGAREKYKVKRRARAN